MHSTNGFYAFCLRGVYTIDLSLVAVYSSISETTDTTRMVEEGYYAAPKSMEKVSHLT
jgi:hypothetical protein